MGGSKRSRGPSPPSSAYVASPYFFWPDCGQQEVLELLNIGGEGVTDAMAGRKSDAIFRQKWREKTTWTINLEVWHLIIAAQFSAEMNL